LLVRRMKPGRGRNRGTAHYEFTAHRAPVGMRKCGLTCGDACCDDSPIGADEPMHGTLIAHPTETSGHEWQRAEAAAYGLSTSRAARSRPRGTVAHASSTAGGRAPSGSSFRLGGLAERLTRAAPHGGPHLKLPRPPGQPLKHERVNRRRFRTRAEARTAIFRWIAWFRGRDGHCGPPPAQIPACASNALGS